VLYAPTAACRSVTEKGPVSSGKILIWFTSYLGTPLDAATVRRALRRVLKTAGLDHHAWTNRELRNSFVSPLSDDGVSLADIADLCGHPGTSVTERVYRHQLRPVLLTNAAAMDRIFGKNGDRER
jgi:integrase